MNAPGRAPSKWLILAVMCLSVFLVVVDNTIVNVALPGISQSLHASNAALQWIVDGYSLPFAGLLLAGGALSDRFGRKRVMQLGLVFFGLFSIGAAFSTSVTTLLLARAAMGLAAAFIFPATLSILTVTFEDPRERATAFGLWGATSGLAVAFGPLVGGALVSHFWFGSIFLVNIPIVIVTIIAGARYIPESRSPQVSRFDIVGLLLGSSGITALVLAIIEGPSWGWLSLSTLGVFTLSLLLLTQFVRYELARHEPLLDVRIFKVPTFSAGAGAIATTFFGLFGFIFLMTQYFQLVRGYSAFSAGVHTVPFAVTAMVITPLGALLALRFGARLVVTSGLVIMAVALVWVGMQGAHAAYFGPIIASMIVMSFGFSLITAPSTTAVMSSLRPEQIGAGAAVNNTTRELGGTMGVAIVGSVFSSRFAPGVATALHGFHLSSQQIVTAQSSMRSALATVAALPHAHRAALESHVVDAFLSGFHRGCFVAAGVVGSVALISAVVLPRHVRSAQKLSLSSALAH
jgi:DHA2 family multidrug resistance protein-like MFS transporter